MISHFPTPYPDELLYSICARFADRVQYPSAVHAFQELFGIPTFPGSLHLPARLDHLISVMPPGHSFTVDQFIDQHTLFPFYAPFLQAESPSKIREAMRLNRGLNAQACIGRVSNQRRWPNQLRACPRCVEEDKQRFGESYWHRVHQILGVEVCPFHACYLLNSELTTNSRHSLAFTSAERAVAEKSLLISGAIDNTPFKWQIAIARDACWLLNQSVVTPGLEALARRYCGLLIQQELATYRGIIRTPKLFAKFNDYYPGELLRRLHSELKEGRHKHWLTVLFRARTLQHPIRHLLLIHFLGYSAETFFTATLDKPPFGEGPWPCLNPVCEQYNQPCIDHCTITYTRSKKHRRKIKPKGTFMCMCGFCYMRFGPDKSDEDRLCLSRVKAFGPVWEKELRRLWENPLLTLNGVAGQLGATHTIVRHQATRLGLTFPRPDRWAGPSEKYFSHSRGSQVIDPETLTRYREAWLAARENYPEAGINFLMNQVKGVYEWLERHDADWLQAHQPARKPFSPLSSRCHVDWGQRDAQWAKKVEVAALHLINLPGRPVKINRASIAREMGLLKNALSGTLEKLPLTKKALLNSLEGNEAFAVRLIKWATALFQQEHLLPTKTRLLKRAGVWDQRNSPLVQHATDDALCMLRSEAS